MSNFKQQVKVLFVTLVLTLVISAVQKANGQNNDLSLIPKLNLEFFRGTPPSGTDYAAKVFIYLDYKYVVSGRTEDGKVRLTVSVKVRLDSASSYFDRSKVSDEKIEGLLKHEQGHVTIAFVIRNRLEKELNDLTYSSNYKEEIKQKFDDSFRNLNNIQLEYDTATNHNTNQAVQNQWNLTIKQMVDDEYQTQNE